MNAIKKRIGLLWHFTLPVFAAYVVITITHISLVQMGYAEVVPSTLHLLLSPFLINLLNVDLATVSSWILVIGVTFVFTNRTVSAVTLFLHRHSTHRSIRLHPVIVHISRFWLWMTTGQREVMWRAIHYIHHKLVDTMNDPHSPRWLGILKVLLEGAEVYRDACQREDVIERSKINAPNDWVERNLYSHKRFRSWGIVLMFTVNILLFGPIGIVIGAIQMAWIPFWAAGIINGLCHYRGKRNFVTDDFSQNQGNIIAFFTWGESWHNNHHAFPTSAKFSMKKGEIDFGWYEIKLLSLIKWKRFDFELCRIRNVAPAAETPIADWQGLKERAPHFIAEFAEVAKTALEKEVAKFIDIMPVGRPAIMRIFEKHPERFDEGDDLVLKAVDSIPQLSEITTSWLEYIQSWKAKEKVTDWYEKAKQSNIEAIREFATNSPSASVLSPT